MLPTFTRAIRNSLYISYSKMLRSFILTRVLISLTFVLLFGNLGNSLPLITQGPWIIDTVSGARVKLQCVTWTASMETMLAEGLDKKPLNDLLIGVSLLGFNCVKLTWATYMFTRPSFSKLLVRESFQNLNLPQDGLLKNNPYFLNLTVVQAFDTVVRELGKQGFMVVLDNVVSKPHWCCKEDDDGDGFWGDKDFDSEEWINGTTIVASRYSGMSQVVGMSLRSTLRGPRQTVHDWRTYVGVGMSKVHEVNRDVLVIVSGLNRASDLSFLNQEDLQLGWLDNKLVYEVHWYSETWADGSTPSWDVGASKRCAMATKSFDDMAGYLTRGAEPVPLFVSEFAITNTGAVTSENRFFSCFLALASERDFDWGIWALQGKYYIKFGTVGLIEFLGILDPNMDKPQNPRIMERLNFIQGSIQGPEVNMSTARLMYHPLTGNCTQLADLNDNLEASSCKSGALLNYAGGTSPIFVDQTTTCFKAVGDGLPVILTSDCSTSQSTWTVLPGTTLQLASMDEHGTQLCLEYTPADSPLILTRQCKCMGPEECEIDPQGQWFSFFRIDFLKPLV